MYRCRRAVFKHETICIQFMNKKTHMLCKTIILPYSCKARLLCIIIVNMLFIMLFELSDLQDNLCWALIFIVFIKDIKEMIQIYKSCQWLKYNY